MRRVISLLAGGALLAGLPLVVRADAAPIDECDWASFGNGPHHTNAAAPGCSEVDATTVSRLQARMLYRTRDSVTSTPTVVDGVIYVGSWDGTVYAFDATATGVGDPALDASIVEPLWEFDTNAHDQNDVSFGRIVGTAAVTDVGGQRVVVIPAGATVFALNASDGTLLASECLDPRTEGRCEGSDPQIEVESSPVITRDGDDALITIGLDVHNRAGVGRTGIVQLRLTPDLELTPEWKFDPEGVGEDSDNGTYRGEDLLTHKAGTGDGCAGVWGTPAVDTEAGVIVFGTASCKAGDATSGTADVVGESVFATNLQGDFLWRYDPPRPWGTRTDDDFGSSAQIFTAQINGVEQKLVGIGDKQGGYYALSLSGGALVWASQPGQPGHANEDFAIGGIIGTPAVGTATVLDPDSGGLVETTAIFATTAISTPVGQPLGTGTPNQWVDASLAEDPGRMLSIHAIDARNGNILWRSPLTRQSYGHPSFVNGVVLVPSTAGFTVQAYEASTGAPLWISTPLNGAPSSGIAAVGNRIFLGAGTRQTDAGYKVFESDSVLADHVGEDPQERLAGIWGFELAG
jgi:outer membrane protein assembly factor BamB